jgi:hypothetical protein
VIFLNALILPELVVGNTRSKKKKRQAGVGWRLRMEQGAATSQQKTKQRALDLLTAALIT